MLTKSINADPAGKKATETDFLVISVSCVSFIHLPFSFQKENERYHTCQRQKSSLESASMSDAVTPRDLFSLLKSKKNVCVCLCVSYLCIYNT